MTDFDESPEAPAWAKLAARLLTSVGGAWLTGYCVLHVVHDSARTPAPGLTHYVVLSVFGILGLCIAGGKHTLAGLDKLAEGIRSWRWKGEGTPPTE